jgi:hypothetical protein
MTRHGLRTFSRARQTVRGGEEDDATSTEPMDLALLDLYF